MHAFLTALAILVCPFIGMQLGGFIELSLLDEPSGPCGGTDCGGAVLGTILGFFIPIAVSLHIAKLRYDREQAWRDANDRRNI